MTYWPGTNIPRSTGNAFDWRRTEGSLVTRNKDWMHSINSKKATEGKRSMQNVTYKISKEKK